MKRFTTLLAATVISLAGTAAAQMPGFGQGGQQQPGMQQPQNPNGQRGFTPPGATNLQSLSGGWYYSWQGGADQSPFQVQVDASGRFQARSSVTTIQGQFNGMAGQGMAVSQGQNGRPMQNAVQLRFDGQCHIQVMMIGSNGRPAGQGMFHVNHRPGEPCPR
ncbi:MAG: hypothetical protein AAFQ22_04125 [Pseudomonadota bacterium]